MASDLGGSNPDLPVGGAGPSLWVPGCSPQEDERQAPPVLRWDVLEEGSPWLIGALVLAPQLIGQVAPFLSWLLQLEVGQSQLSPCEAWVAQRPGLTARTPGSEHFANSPTSFNPLNLKITQVKYYNHGNCHTEEVLGVKEIKSGLKSTHKHQVQTGFTGNLCQTNR